MELSLEAIHRRCDVCGDCLLWRGSKNPKGYPKVTVRENGKESSLSLRRLVYLLHKKRKNALGAKTQVAVTCGRVACVNPHHLELLTKSEVIRRSSARPAVKLRRVAAAKRNSQKLAKLDMDKARYIRECGLTQIEVARELKISQALVSRVRLGRAWQEPEAGLFAGLGAR